MKLRAIGLDMGFRHFVVSSEGDFIDQHDALAFGRQIAKRYQVVCVETLVGDKFFFINAWLDWLRGEVAKHGGKFIAIGRWVRSTWTCHRCLCAVESCGLEVREWECPQCHQLHERDVNAACNIMREGLKIYYSQRELLNA